MQIVCVKRKKNNLINLVQGAGASQDQAVVAADVKKKVIADTQARVKC